MDMFFGLRISASRNELIAYQPGGLVYTYLQAGCFILSSIRIFDPLSLTYLYWSSTIIYPYFLLR